MIAMTARLMLARKAKSPITLKLGVVLRKRLGGNKATTRSPAHRCMDCNGTVIVPAVCVNNVLISRPASPPGEAADANLASGPGAARTFGRWGVKRLVWGAIALALAPAGRL